MVRSEVFFPSVHSVNVFPVNEHIGKCADPEQNPASAVIKAALSAEYNLEWLETYVNNEFRSPAATLWSELLSDLLPVSEYVFSVPFTNSDGSVSVSVWLPEKKILASFAVAKNGISAMGFDI